MTASVSAIDERPELVVGHEPALACAELLDLGQKLGAAILRDVEAELLRLDADRVEPALLAKHDRTVSRDETRRVRLDRRWVMELRRDRAGLAAEQRLAGDGLPRFECVPGQPAHLLRHIANAIELQARLDAVE